MLQIKSDLNLVTRFDLKMDSWILNSGVTGTFVKWSGDNAVRPTAGSQAYFIWTESNKDGSQGWTPDALASQKITVVYGKHRAATDQYVGNPAAGEKLYVNADGKLTTTPTGENVVIAYCTKAPTSVTELGRKYNVIEFALV